MGGNHGHIASEELDQLIQRGPDKFTEPELASTDDGARR